MRYFYDHQTDVLTISVGNFADYESSLELANAITLHVDGSQRPLAAEIHSARSLLDTTALKSFEEHTIVPDDLERRLAKSDAGRDVWRLLVSPSIAARS